MSIELLSLALRQNIPTRPKFVLVALANHSNQDGECWSSQGNIAAQTSLSLKAVKQNIAWLAKHGYLLDGTHDQQEIAEDDAEFGGLIARLNLRPDASFNNQNEEARHGH